MDTAETLRLLALEQDHESLLQFVYMAPVGLLQARGDGEIVMLNPMSSQLLMPLSRDGNLDNLFLLLQDVLPDLQDRLDRYSGPTGMVCDGIHLPLETGHGAKVDHQLLSFSLLKVSADRYMALLQDVTEQVRQAHRLQQQEAWLSAILSSVTDYALVCLNRHGHVLEWNDSLQRIGGFGPDAVVGKPMSVFYADDAITPDRMADHLCEARLGGCSLDTGWRVRADGSRYWGSALITPLHVTAGAPEAGGAVNTDSERAPAYCLVLRDLTEHRDTADLARLAAVCDHLTGLHNRRAFFDAAEREIRRLKHRPRSLSLVLFDADHFKQVNDTHGHPVGDAVLRHIATTLHNGFREVDVVARIGGEEFAVLLPSTDLQGAHTVAERVCRKLAASPATTTAGEVLCTVSAGIATMTDCAAGDLDALMQRADQALYAAKAAGRNRVCGLTPGR